MKRIKGALTAGLVVCMLTAGGVQAFGLDSVYACPNGNTACAEAGYCVYGECPDGVYICPNGNAACVEAGHCVYGVCRSSGGCRSTGHGHYAAGTGTTATTAARGHGRGGHHR